jgi:multidrug efflux pump subunit AcrA (membrane-fusion protein)
MKGQAVASLTIALALTGFGSGYFARKKTAQELKTSAELRKSSPPLVNSVKVKRAPSRREVVLPGTITPITEA